MLSKQKILFMFDRALTDAECRASCDCIHVILEGRRKYQEYLRDDTEKLRHVAEELRQTTEELRVMMEALRQSGVEAQ